MSVRAYLVRRLGLLVLVLVGISLVTFLLVRVVPVGPGGDLRRSARPCREQIAQARHILGLDRPLYVQYGIYVRDLVQRRLGHLDRARGAPCSATSCTSCPTPCS